MVYEKVTESTSESFSMFAWEGGGHIGHDMSESKNSSPNCPLMVANMSSWHARGHTAAAIGLPEHKQHQQVTTLMRTAQSFKQ